MAVPQNLPEGDRFMAREPFRCADTTTPFLRGQSWPRFCSSSIKVRNLEFPDKPLRERRSSQDRRSSGNHRSRLGLSSHLQPETPTRTRLRPSRLDLVLVGINFGYWTRAEPSIGLYPYLIMGSSAMPLLALPISTRSKMAVDQDLRPFPPVRSCWRQPPFIHCLHRLSSRGTTDKPNPVLYWSSRGATGLACPRYAQPMVSVPSSLPNLDGPWP